MGDDIVEIRNRTDNIIPIGGQTPLEVTVGISNTTLQGGDGNDFLLGGIGKFSEGSNVFDGGAGNDTIQSFAVQDSISGGDGDDILMTMTSDVLTAEGVNSGLPGFAGESTLDGGEGDDTITASFESDIMFGGGGDDLMSGLFTLMDGGDGNDTLDGSGFVRTATTSLEVNLSGGAGNDLLIGASQAETATGLINIFAGGSGDDTITLNSTSDVLLTDSANLEGNDSITANYEFENDIAPEDEVFTFFDTLGDNIINGSLGDDSIVGGDGDDILRGGTQVDITDENRAELPFIGAGNDTIAAGGGDDFLFGGQGDDSLIGQDGNDTLQGSFNSDPVADGPSFGDTLVGGEGNDSFFYQFQDEVFQSNGAVSTLADLIGDFETLSDRLVFTRASGTNGGFNFASTGRPNDSELIELGANQTYIASPGTNISTPNTVVADIGTGVLVYQRQGGTMLYDPDGNGPLAATTLARFSLDNDGRGPDISRTDVTFI
ncbi:MAG: calcium-binding protein [Cyanobacteriota bacterium]|nr:calcium-binding protein [Cyanobacteriota bacterium]